MHYFTGKLSTIELAQPFFSGGLFPIRTLLVLLQSKLSPFCIQLVVASYSEGEQYWEEGKEWEGGARVGLISST